MARQYNYAVLILVCVMVSSCGRVRCKIGERNPDVHAIRSAYEAIEIDVSTTAPDLCCEFEDAPLYFAEAATVTFDQARGYVTLEYVAAGRDVVELWEVEGGQTTLVGPEECDFD